MLAAGRLNPANTPGRRQLQHSPQREAKALHQSCKVVTVVLLVLPSTFLVLHLHSRFTCRCLVLLHYCGIGGKAHSA
jgi:hypothetical protein